VEEGTGDEKRSAGRTHTHAQSRTRADCFCSTARERLTLEGSYRKAYASRRQKHRCQGMLLVKASIWPTAPLKARTTAEPACLEGPVYFFCARRSSRVPYMKFQAATLMHRNRQRNTTATARKVLVRRSRRNGKDAGCIHDSLKGVMMPDGAPGPNKLHKGGYLLYDEYVAYDVSQLRLRYLFGVQM
jgi:hypothetical protein